MSDVIKEHLSLKENFIKVKHLIENSSDQHTITNSLNLVTTLENKIDIQIRQINPMSNIRNRRGIINGLGTMIKSLTGNLDQEDAEKYDKAISSISNNQDKVRSLLKQQITIIQKSSSTFETLTKNISLNQQILEKRIKQAEIITKQIQTNNTNSYGFFLGQILLSQFINAFQNIHDILENIEIAITFSKLNVFHSSIIDPKDLLNEIKQIGPHLIQSKLPFEATLENILLFEKIVEIKGYTKENKFFFIIEIPIVGLQNFVLYRLYPLPVPFNKKFQIIIPHNKYLILNEHTYALFDNECKEVATEKYICKENSPISITTEPPCEVQMLLYSKHPSNCQAFQTDVPSLKVQKLEREEWLLVSPQETVAVQQCGANKDNIPLQGTYILELNPGCTIQIQNFLIHSYHDSRTKFHNIELPKLTFDVNINPNTIDFQPFQLNSINLEELKNIQNTIALHQQSLQEMSKEPVIHYQKISLWTIFLYIGIFCLFSLSLYRKIQAQRKRKTTRHEKEDVEVEDTRQSQIMI